MSLIKCKITCYKPNIKRIVSSFGVIMLVGGVGYIDIEEADFNRLSTELSRFASVTKVDANEPEVAAPADNDIVAGIAGTGEALFHLNGTTAQNNIQVEQPAESQESEEPKTQMTSMSEIFNKA